MTTSESIKPIWSQVNYNPIIPAFLCYFAAIILFSINIELFMLFMLLSSLFLSVYIITQNDYVNITGLYLFLYLGISYVYYASEYVVNKNTLFMNVLYSTWIILSFVLTPTLLLSITKYVFSKRPYLLNVLVPKDEEEIKREDGMIIDLVGFMQSLLIISFFKGDLLTLQIYAIIGLCLFIFLRGYSIIKDSPKYRYYSAISLVTIIVIDFLSLLFILLVDTNIFVNLSNIFNLPMDILGFIFFINSIITTINAFNEIIHRRYIQKDDPKLISYIIPKQEET